MSLRLLKISGTTNAGKLRVLKVSGTAAQSSSKLRVLRVSGTTGLANGRLRLRQLSGTVGSPLTVVPFADQSANPFDLVQLTATASQGVPSSWRFTLQPNGQVHTLPLTVSGATVTFTAPGRFNGCDVVILAEAMLNGSPVSSQTATIHVSKHNEFIRKGGAWVAISRPKIIHK